MKTVEKIKMGKKEERGGGRKERERKRGKKIIAMRYWKADPCVYTLVDTFGLFFSIQN